MFSFTLIHPFMGIVEWKPGHVEQGNYLSLDSSNYPTCFSDSVAAWDPLSVTNDFLSSQFMLMKSLNFFYFFLAYQSFYLYRYPLAGWWFRLKFFMLQRLAKLPIPHPVRLTIVCLLQSVDLCSRWRIRLMPANVPRRKFWAYSDSLISGIRHQPIGSRSRSEWFA